jgi:MOSC domain-containing protein YiiM
MRVVSVNVGRPAPLVTGKRVVQSAIGKTPVEGPVAVRGVNLEGDDQADRSVHGGPDQAVYAYASEDIAYWSDVTGLDLGPGAFGENLTTAGIDVSGARIGERWRIGTVELRVTGPRIPCFKLEARIGVRGFQRAFLHAGRPGAYFAITQEGELQAGDAIEILHRPGPRRLTAADRSRRCGWTGRGWPRSSRPCRTCSPSWRSGTTS